MRPQHSKNIGCFQQRGHMNEADSGPGHRTHITWYQKAGDSCSGSWAPPLFPWAAVPRWSYIKRWQKTLYRAWLDSWIRFGNERERSEARFIGRGGQHSQEAHKATLTATMTQDKKRLRKDSSSNLLLLFILCDLFKKLFLCFTIQIKFIFSFFIFFPLLFNVFLP